MVETSGRGALGGGVVEEVIVDILCLLVSAGETARPLVSDGLLTGGWCIAIGGVATLGISVRSPRFASFAHAEAKIFWKDTNEALKSFV